MDFVLNFCAELLQAFLPNSEWAKKWKQYQRAKDLECQIKSTVLVIQLQTDRLEYQIPQYERLNDTRLVDIRIPVSNELTEWYNGTTIATPAAHANGILNLQDKRSNNIYQDIPGFDLLRAWISTSGYFPDNRKKFNLVDIDWTKSRWKYPSNTIPNAETGDVVLLIVDYIDLPSPV